MTVILFSEDCDVAWPLNYFSSSIATNLKILEHTDNNSKCNDSIIKTILKYGNYASILTTGEICKERSTVSFSFSEVCKEEILKYILIFNTSKACQDTDVLTRAINKNAEIFAEFLHWSLNKYIKNSNFLSGLKKGNIKPVFKKREKEFENNYRSVSILSNVLKVFEGCKFKQISNYIEYYLSKYQCRLERL